MVETNRKGDKVKIDGGYQYDAIHKGNVFQRNWHALKLKTAVMLAGTSSNGKILDVGCGSGILLSFLPVVPESYLGIDANEAAISFAQQTYSNKQITFHLCQIDDLHLFPESSFTQIFFLETIEHITEEQGQYALQQFYRLLQPGGICVISTPNRKSLWPAIEWLLDLFRLTPQMNETQHEKLYSTGELKKIALHPGFQLKSLKTINGVAPWLSFLGNKSTQMIHNWELKNSWVPGSLILMALRKESIKSDT